MTAVPAYERVRVVWGWAKWSTFFLRWKSWMKKFIFSGRAHAYLVSRSPEGLLYCRNHWISRFFFHTIVSTFCGSVTKNANMCQCGVPFQTFPFFGVVPKLINEEGKIVEGKGEGYLVSVQLHTWNTVKTDVSDSSRTKFSSDIS